MRQVVGMVLVGAALAVSAGDHDWQNPQAQVLPDGELAYAPAAWDAPRLKQPRYIDFAAGDDARDGRTPATAWKHHPNDPAATGNAKAAKGPIDGYVFKKGVAYRGKLTGALKDVVLCSQPGYGEGRAEIVGSRPVARSAWTPGAAPRMPQADKVWCVAVDHPVRAVWCRAKPDAPWTRLNLARTPNWSYADPDDVMAGWWQWEQPEWWLGKNVVTINGHKAHLGIDSQKLKGWTAEDLVGGLVWSEWGIVMGTPFASKIESYDAARGAIAFQGFWYNDSEKIITKNRYYLEDRPAFLDAPGEFWFDRQGNGGTLYARFPGDVDPRTLDVETSDRCDGFNLAELRNVRITGLAFGRIGPHWRLEARPFEDGDIPGAAIRANGNLVNVTIDHCTFSDVNAAIRLKAVNDDNELDKVRITDNLIVDCDQTAIDVGGSQRWGKNDGPYARTGTLDILRNKLERIGKRPARSESGHALTVSFIARTHIAGNFVSRTCGAGIFVFSGKPDGDKSDCPFARTLIHHNRVEDPLLMANDWGGIETWQGGPAYVWGNLSKNPGGYWNWAAKEGSQRLGFAYYLDGSFKNYHFDNWAVGKSSDPKSKLCNASALYQATPTVLNAFYNNTYRTFAQGSGWNPQGGRHIFAGNRFEDISVKVFDHKEQKEDAGHAYGGRVLKDSVFMVDNATPENPAAARHVRPFIPWSLARTVGEWNFRQGVAGLDEHWYMSPTMTGRFDYWKHARNDLDLPADVKIVAGGREDWVASVAQFAGTPAVLKGRTPAAEKAAAEVKDPFAAGTQTVKPKDWLEVTLPKQLVFGKNLEAKITLKNIPSDLVGKKLLFHWHWLKAGGWGGYLSHVYVAPKVTGDGEYRVKLINIPAMAPNGLNAHSFLVGIGDDDEIGHCVRRGDFTIDASAPGAIQEAPQVSPQAEFPMAIGRKNFSLEAVVATTQKGGSIAEALADGRGFALTVDAKGVPVFRFAAAGAAVSVTGRTTIADGRFHHVFAEIDRAAGKARLYIDGQLADAQPFTAATADATTTADLLVGKGFVGGIDFLRIAHASLAESHTDIAELHAWEFAGPFLEKK